MAETVNVSVPLPVGVPLTTRLPLPLVGTVRPAIAPWMSLTASATVPVPPLALTVKQILVASADLLVAAWVLFMLMPHMKGVDYLEFVGIYMVAYVLVVLSHVPGGIGVLEPAVLIMLPPRYGVGALAALIVFRVIYFWIPLLLALAILGGHEIALRKRGLGT